MNTTKNLLPEEIKSESEWEAWLSSLREGDECLYQDFVPVGNGVADSWSEYWKYWPATFQGNRIFYRNTNHSIKNGIGGFRNSGNPVNKIFPGRIVPAGSTPPKLVNYSADFLVSPRPIFEPKWHTDRCFLIVKSGPKLKLSITVRGELEKTLKEIPFYCRKVNDQRFLVTCFCPSKELMKLIEGTDLLFLYSEDMRDVS